MFYFLLSHAYSFYFWHYGESPMNLNFALEVYRLCYLHEDQYEDKVNLTTHMHTEQQSNNQHSTGRTTLYSDITIQSFIIVKYKPPNSYETSNYTFHSLLPPFFLVCTKKPTNQPKKKPKQTNQPTNPKQNQKQKPTNSLHLLPLGSVQEKQKAI